jgi:CBS domain-containing protein
MAQSVRNVMTSNPCTIDADKSVAYAAKMMRDEDVGLAPIVEGDKLIGMLTDRDIAVRVSAQGKNPDQVKARDVASKKLVTIDPQQDLDEALRIMAKHQVRRLPVVEEDGRLVGVVAQADIARRGDDAKTGRLVEEISEPGGQMSSIEGQYPGQFESQLERPQIGQEPSEPEVQPEEEGISRVRAASTRRRRRTTTTGARKKRTTTARKRTTGARKKRTTTARKRSAGTRARSTARRSTAGRKRATTTRKKRTTTARKRTTARRAPSRAAAAKGGRKTARKRTTTRKRTTARRAPSRAAAAKGGRKTARKRTTTRKRTTARRAPSRAAAAKGGRKTARKRTTRRRTSR